MSGNQLTPREILASASDRVKKTVNEILQIEHEYQNYRNLSAAGQIEKDIGHRIKQIIEREIKK